MSNSKNNGVFFSIIIPTRNRPALFSIALESVLSQEFDDFEIIIVNDGSTESCHEDYLTIKKNIRDERVSFYSLVQRPHGHGSSYAMNFGVSKAKGKYICFLDDDDYWTDDYHLDRAYNDLCQSKEVVEIYYTNQYAYFSDGSRKEATTWIENLRLSLKNQDLNSKNVYKVSINDLLVSDSFSHFNCTIVNTFFFNSIDGLDEDIRYENDRDFYFRCIDSAKLIMYSPHFIARHNIPDQKVNNNISTSLGNVSKYLYQLMVYDKAILMSKNKILIKNCLKGKSYVLKNLALELYCTNRYEESCKYAWQALAIRFNFKWFAFTTYLTCKSYFIS